MFFQIKVFSKILAKITTSVFFDVLIKLDLIDNEDMKEVSEFLDKLLQRCTKGT